MEKKRSITKDFLIVLVVIVIGKVLGLARELVVSYLYGSSVDTDAFYFVNSLITAIFSVITMGLGQAFTPTYLDIQIKNGKSCSTQFANKITTILVFIGFVVCVLLALFPKFWLSLLAPDLSVKTKEIAEKMLRLMAPCAPIYILFSIRKCILNSHQKYIVTEASGIPYSISIALLTMLLFKQAGNMALPIAALTGVLFQYLFTFLFSKRNYSYSLCKISTKDPDIRHYFVMLIPIAASAVLEEANGLLRKSLAGGIAEGAIANLSYCMTLTTLVNGIVITSISTVYFPHLIKNYSEGDVPSFKTNASGCIGMASVLVIPVVAFLFVFAEDVVRLVYERGSFTSADTAQVSSLFMVYVLGSIIYAYRCIIKTAFFATQDAKTPMINEMLYLILCMTLNIIQIKVFRVGLVALGIAWVISIAIMTPILFFCFKNKHFGLLDRCILFETVKSVAATAAFVAVEMLMMKKLELSGTYVRLAVSGVTAVLIYVAAMTVMKSSTILNLLHIFKKGELNG